MNTKRPPSSSIADGFARYKAEVIPKTAGPTQIRETKIAYYAGALTTFGLVLAATDLPDEDAAVALDRLKTEITNWLDDVMHRMDEGEKQS